MSLISEDERIALLLLVSIAVSDNVVLKLVKKYQVELGSDTNVSNLIVQIFPALLTNTSPTNI